MYIWNKQNSYAYFDFPVIQPVSAESKLIISKDNNLAMPKLFADLSLEEIDILLSRQQVSHNLGHFYVLT